jgi:hypothetical protein
LRENGGRNKQVQQLGSKETVKLKPVGDRVELVSNFAHQSTLEHYSHEDDDGCYQGILENIRPTRIFQHLVDKLPGSVHRLSPESLCGLAVWDCAALTLQGSYSGESVRRCDGRSEMIGDHVEFVLNPIQKVALGGDSTQRKDRGDERVFNKVRAAFIVQQVLQQMSGTVHFVSPLFPHRAKLDTQGAPL